jgi:ATP-dependent Clp protease adaptor protein ClpS
MTTPPPVTPGPATPTTRPHIEDEPDTALAPLWHVILLDDDDHTYEYVIEMLAAVFGYGAEKSWALARTVDTQGRVILLTAGKPPCERKQDQIHAYGADPRIPRSKGSMTAVVEQADAPEAG